MVAGYKFVDNLVATDISLFSDLGLQYMLELNHIVLCGRDPRVRLEYTQHITETRRRFYQYIQPIKRWYKKHKNESTLKVASEVYVGILSRPQLYIEGNHRTGSLIATYLLLTRGSPPFVLNVDNAVAYFQPSSQIKFSDKTSFKGKLRLPKYEKAFKAFLEENLSEDFLLHPTSHESD
jgi:prophage maintenance system killer protein